MSSNSTDRMVKIDWVTKFRDDQIGNLYGYKTHNQTLFKYASQIAEITPEAENALFITTPEFYPKKLEGKVNFLFTMFEGTNLPEQYRQNIQYADYIITPSGWVKEIFSKYFIADKIFVVPHGVERDFTYCKRNSYPNHFRFMWVGAANPRKGWQELAMVWQEAGFWMNPHQELYIKTTGLKGPPLQQKANVILDSRDLSRQELVSLYHSAHCFVFPTRGEGFGLTLAEAMATGMPCIATNFSGVTEFFNENVGYPIDYHIGEGYIKSAFYDDLGTIFIAVPDVIQLAEKMIWVRDHYNKALDVGKKASMHIKQKFTWERSAEILVDIIRTYGR